MIIKKTRFGKDVGRVRGAIRALASNSGNVMVVRRLGGVGDILNMRMIFQDLKGLVGEKSQVWCSVPRELMPLVMDHPYIDRIVPWEEASSFISSNSFSFVGDITSSCLRHERAHRGSTKLQRADIWADSLGLTLTRHDQHLGFSPEEVSKARELMESVDAGEGPTVILSPHSHANSRDLPDHLVEVTVAWAKERGVRLILSTTKTAGIANSIVPRVVFPDFRTWMASFALARGCVTTDTGALHGAGGTRCPTVALFGYTSKLVVPAHYPSVSPVQLLRDEPGGLDCCPCYDWGSCPFLKIEPLPLKCHRDVPGETWRTNLDSRIWSAISSSEDPKAMFRDPAAYVKSSLSRGVRPARISEDHGDAGAKALPAVDCRDLGLRDTLACVEELASVDRAGSRYRVVTRFADLISAGSYSHVVPVENVQGSSDVDVPRLLAGHKGIPPFRSGSVSKEGEVGYILSDRPAFVPEGQRSRTVVRKPNVDSGTLSELSRATCVATKDPDLAELAVCMGIPVVYTGSKDLRVPYSRGWSPGAWVVRDDECNVRAVVSRLARPWTYCDGSLRSAISLASMGTERVAMQSRSVGGDRDSESDALSFLTGRGIEVRPLVDPRSAGSVKPPKSLLCLRSTLPSYTGLSVVDAEISIAEASLEVIPDVKAVGQAWESWMDEEGDLWVLNPSQGGWSLEASQKMSTQEIDMACRAIIARGDRIAILGTGRDRLRRFGDAGGKVLDLVGKTSLDEALDICSRSKVVVGCSGSLAGIVWASKSRRQLMVIKEPKGLVGFSESRLAHEWASADSMAKWVPKRARRRHEVATSGVTLVAVGLGRSWLERSGEVLAACTERIFIGSESERNAFVALGFVPMGSGDGEWSMEEVISTVAKSAAKSANTVLFVSNPGSSLGASALDSATSQLDLGATFASWGAAGAWSPGAKRDLEMFGISSGESIDVGAWMCRRSTVEMDLMRGRSVRPMVDGLDVSIWKGGFHCACCKV